MLILPLGTDPHALHSGSDLRPCCVMGRISLTFVGTRDDRPSIRWGALPRADSGVYCLSDDHQSGNYS